MARPKEAIEVDKGNERDRIQAIINQLRATGNDGEAADLQALYYESLSKLTPQPGEGLRGELRPDDCHHEHQATEPTATGRNGLQPHDSRHEHSVTKPAFFGGEIIRGPVGITAAESRQTIHELLTAFESSELRFVTLVKEDPSQLQNLIPEFKFSGQIDDSVVSAVAKVVEDEKRIYDDRGFQTSMLSIKKKWEFKIVLIGAVALIIVAIIGRILR